MCKREGSPANWPPSIANWQAFENRQSWLGTEEFPLFTDAWITGETAAGPYQFLNTVAFKSGGARPAIVLRYPIHKAWERPDFEKTDTDLYHGGSPQQELAAFASLAMGIRLRAGHSTRRFEPNGDPLGTPTELGDREIPSFHLRDRPNLPFAAGPHALEALSVLNRLPSVSQREACAIVRASRLYQDGLWLAESQPEVTWLLLVSALETAANEWKKKSGEVARLRDAKPKLFEYLDGLKDRSILPTVAEHIADSLGITTKFVEFMMEFLPEPPKARPPKWAQFEWETDNLKKALKTIYGYRSRALHDGRPFPLPMCEAPRLDSTWEAPAEKMFAMAASHGGGVWLQKDIPMNLHLFEYIARNVLIEWLKSCAQKSPSS